jgi:hypothetical protein
VIVGLTLAGLVADGVGYLMVNMLSWMGGPVGLAAIMTVTVITGLILCFLPAKSAASQTHVIGLTMTLWMIGSVIVFVWADGVQQRLWIEDTERVAKEYGKGELPPNCQINGTYRGSVHTPLECKGKVTDVAAWYRSRLGPEWTETGEPKKVIFTRTQSNLPDQKIVIFNDFIFVEGTSVIVSPTQTNK